MIVRALLFIQKFNFKMEELKELKDFTKIYILANKLKLE